MLWTRPGVVFVGAPSTTALGRSPAALAVPEGLSPSPAFELLAGGPPGRVVRAELGAVNAWRSVGPLPVRLGVGAAEIDQLLRGHPELADCRVPVALELVVDDPQPAWWAAQVSTPADAVHRVDAGLVAGLLRDVG